MFSFVKFFFVCFVDLLHLEIEQEHKEIGRTHMAGGGAAQHTQAHVVNQDQACILVGDLYNVFSRAEHVQNQISL